MTTHERSLLAFEKPPILDSTYNFAHDMGNTACLLAAVIATETRIPLFTRDSDDSVLRAEELRFFFDGLPEATLRLYASETQDRTAAVAVYRRTRHTAATERAKNYEQSNRDLRKAIHDLGVLSTTYTFAGTNFQEQVVELAASTILVEAAQAYVPSQRTIYNISQGALASQLGGAHNQPRSIATQFPDQPINLFAGKLTDIVEYSPVFRRREVIRYGAPEFE